VKLPLKLALSTVRFMSCKSNCCSKYDKFVEKEKGWLIIEAGKSLAVIFSALIIGSSAGAFIYIFVCKPLSALARVEKIISASPGFSIRVKSASFFSIL
jgi:hypothetical protein